MRYDIVRFNGELRLRSDVVEWIKDLKEIRAKIARRATIERHIRLKGLCWYVTFTFDKKKKDRYKKYSDSLTKLLKRYGFQYVLVAETHKDGGYHYHGFLSNGVGFKYKFTDKYGSKAFKLEFVEKNYGMTTCYYVVNKKIINYIVKYAVKQGNYMLFSRIRVEGSLKKAIDLFGEKIVYLEP